MSNLPTILFVKRKKSKNPRGAQAFFSKNLNFFAGWRAQANFGFGGDLLTGGFCGFWDFGGSTSGLRRLSNGLVSVLSMGKRMLRAFSSNRLLGERISAKATLPTAEGALFAALRG